MTITAVMVKELRTRTGAGMMECKQALSETNGDMEAAVEVLRKRGAAKADKKAGRVAAEGAIASLVADDARVGAVVEVNCETDFVAKDANFLAFAEAVVRTIAAKRPVDVDALNRLTLDGHDKTVDEARVELFTKIGENISVRRFEVLEATGEARISGYQHGSRIGVLVSSTGGREDLGRDIAMHIAASRPLCVSKEQVPQDVLAKEREIFLAQAEESGKPANILEKIVEGRVQKFFNEVTLVGQAYVKDPDQTVGKLLKTQGAVVNGFVRYEVGEGLEKREDNFVAEVMAQAKGG